MSLFRLFAAASFLTFATSASATSFVVTTDAIVGAIGATSDATSSSTFDDKIVKAARDDAASFVASQGAIRGVHLEAALTHLRSQQPQLEASDMQIAEAILAQ